MEMGNLCFLGPLVSWRNINKTKVSINISINIMKAYNSVSLSYQEIISRNPKIVIHHIKNSINK
jgi:hypothetical protein